MLVVVSSFGLTFAVFIFDLLHNASWHSERPVNGSGFPGLERSVDGISELLATFRPAGYRK